MSAGLNVLFSPGNISLHLEKSETLHVSFQSNPAPPNITFIIEDSDCQQCNTSQLTVPVTEIEKKVSIYLIFIFILPMQ